MRLEEALASVFFESLGSSRKISFNSRRLNREVAFDVVGLSVHQDHSETDGL
jgi:hypothetical protein